MNLHKYLLFLCLGLLFSCKKEIKNPPDPIEPVEPAEADYIKADIYDYFNRYSLWTEQIPDLNEEERLAFVQRYSSNESLLTALKGMTPYFNFEPYLTLDIPVGTRYDRYSFLDETEAEGNISYADGFRMDTEEGYGLYFFWGQVDEDGEKWARPVLYLVEGGSPGDKKGLKRGMIVLEINELTETRVAVIYREGGYYINDRAQAKRIQDSWYDAMEGSVLTLKTKDAENRIEKYILDYATSYEIDPVVLDSIYTYPEKKIGYLVYSSFEQVKPRTHPNYTKMEQIFTSFEAAGIRDLILDLRYNPGGYVETATYLANKMVGASAENQLMLRYETNAYLRNSSEYRNEFRDQDFERNNNLDLENVFVLVSEQTASAAELLISVLKPYMNIVLIGDAERTYGKPVGFFEQEIADSGVYLWAASFKTMNNAKTEEDKAFQDYWNGLKVKKNHMALDRISRDFGDVEEDMLAKALTLSGVTINGSSMRASAAKRSTTSGNTAVKIGVINTPRERHMLKRKN